MVGQHTKQQDKDSRVSDVKINVNITSYINQPMSELTTGTHIVSHQQSYQPYRLKISVLDVGTNVYQ